MALWIAYILTAAAAFAGGFDARFETIKREATARELYSLLYDLPKGGDIHHHLGLSSWASDLWASATDSAIHKGNEFYTRMQIKGCQGDSFPALRFLNIDRKTYQQLADCGQSEFQPLSKLTAAERDAWHSSLILDLPGEGRNEFFEAIVLRSVALFRNPDLLKDQMIRMLRRYGRENIRYVESQTSSAAAQVDAIRSALASKEAVESGVAMRLQNVIIRFHPQAEENLKKAYEFVAANRDLFVGVNMAGREDNDKGHALRFLDTFRQMRRTHSGIHLSIHGGEKDSPGSEVRHTLLLGAERIGHGLNLITDPDTMLLMRNGRHLVESNLVSNQLLEYTPDLSKHPFPEYLRFGIPVCLNTDDSGVWDSQFTDEYFLAIRHFKLTWKEVVTIGRNSLAYSFAEPELKAKLLASYDSAVTAFERRYDRSDWRAPLNSVRPEVSGYARRRLGID
ncbi:MAG: adenosine deaminase [Candidatus Solibacter usitatus]|nr:adenosine deaminase [Candidatus Solibacter usitatus]